MIEVNTEGGGIMDVDQDGRITLYGIYDTKDDIWIGTDDGPNRYDNLILARVAAQVVEFRVLGTDLACRFIAKPIPSNGLRKRDDITPKIGAVEALRCIENGEPHRESLPIIIDMNDVKRQAQR